mmetsp:Transcript_14621/g.22162  ORF Transcript_14621/g.22162 Transcript_14621/m.22162 type:complete len:230 (-) Transcript_14621:234-923(-)
MTTESSPLLQQNSPSTPSSKPYYFLAGRKESVDNELSYERLPAGATEEEFLARPVMGTTTSTSQSRHHQSNSSNNKNPNLFARIFGISNASGQKQQQGGNHRSSHRRQGGGLNLKSSSKAAIKVEPKVFFANERTFLAWLHTSVLLAGASIAITSFSEGSLMNQLYGIILLPVAIMFLCYAMHQYGRRSKMIRTTAPGPYEDIVGPSVLAIVLIVSIIAQFSIKLYTLL